MIIDGIHEKELFVENYPFRLALNTEDNFDYPEHWHNATEIIYVLENDYELIVNGTRFQLDEKDILLISGGDIHGFSTRANQGRRAFIQFDISMLDGFGDIKSIMPILSFTKKISCKENSELHRILEEQLLKLIEEYENKAFAYALSINARIFDILVILSRGLMEQINPVENKSSNRKAFGLEKINKALKFIEESYQSDPTLENAAKAAGFSEYHFSRLFKEISGKNFHDYVNDYRIKKAEKLLMSNDMTMIQIAYSVGFNSTVTFNRVFKNLKGCSPTTYKKMYV